jgi:hypothetical protein
MSILLIFFSWGWNIIFEELPNLDIAAPVCLFLMVVHVIILTLGKVMED